MTVLIDAGDDAPRGINMWRFDQGPRSGEVRFEMYTILYNIVRFEICTIAEYSDYALIMTEMSPPPLGENNLKSK